MDARRIQAVTSLSSKAFEGFPDATKGVLEMLEGQLPGSAVFVGHLDHDQDRFWIVDARGDESFELESGTNLPLKESFCINMANGRAPLLSNAAGDDPVYGALSAQADLDIASYVGVPLSLSDGRAVGSLCAINHEGDAYTDQDLGLLQVTGRMLAYELERELAARDLNALHDELRRQATTDPLTNLKNRRSFEQALEREWLLCERDRIESYVGLLDLDGFKAVNDEHGHEAGDAVLKIVADCLREAARQTDECARVGGDEFAVLLVRTEPGAQEAFIARLREGIQRRLADAPYEVCLSAGFQSLIDVPEAGEALRMADAAMYRDKRERSARQQP